MLEVPGCRVMVSVSSCTRAPGRSATCPLGRRLAWGRLRRTTSLALARRRSGTGSTTPRATRWLRMRPTVLSETAKPSATQQHHQLGPAPHREVLAQPLRRLDQRRLPGSAAWDRGAAASAAPGARPHPEPGVASGSSWHGSGRRRRSPPPPSDPGPAAHRPDAPARNGPAPPPAPAARLAGRGGRRRLAGQIPSCRGSPLCERRTPTAWRSPPPNATHVSNLSEPAQGRVHCRWPGGRAAMTPANPRQASGDGVGNLADP